MKKAFTMMELVFVIVIMGVLLAVIVPTTKTNQLEEAAVQLASHLRYTQHLAMVDDKYDANRIDANGTAIWYKERWQLVFSASKFSAYAPAYTIFSDKAGGSTGDAQETEIAINPENHNQRMTGGYGDSVAIWYGKPGFKGMKQLNLGKKYGISNIYLSGGCSNNRVSFDYLGRPLKGDSSSMNKPYNNGATRRLVNKDCEIKLTGPDSKYVTLLVKAETGYVSIDFQ